MQRKPTLPPLNIQNANGSNENEGEEETFKLDTSAPLIHKAAPKKLQPLTNAPEVPPKSAATGQNSGLKVLAPLSRTSSVNTANTTTTTTTATSTAVSQNQGPKKLTPLAQAPTGNTANTASTTLGNKANTVFGGKKLPEHKGKGPIKLAPLPPKPGSSNTPSK